MNGGEGTALALVASVLVGAQLLGAWLLWNQWTNRSGLIALEAIGPSSRSVSAEGAPGHSRNPGAGDPTAALVLELVAAMLEAGASIHRSLAVSARAVGVGNGAVLRAAVALELGVPWDQAWPAASDDLWAEELREALAFAAGTGAPSAELISARARMLRRRRHRELERRAAALGVRLVIPLGVCSLPSFLCLGVVPVLLSLNPSG